VSFKLTMLAIAAGTNFCLGVFVLFKNRRILVNKLFALFAGFVTFWVLFVLLTESANSPVIALFWDRMTFATTSLLPVSCLIFVSVFPLKRALTVTRDIKIFTAIGFVFFFLSFTPFIIHDVSIETWGVKDHCGPGISLFAIYFLACMFWAIVGRLYMQSYRTRGVERLQIQYLAMGITVSTVIGVMTNLLIPMFFKSSYFAGFGPSFSIIMIGFIAHTIVRYKLLQIHLVLRKGFVYSLSIVIAAGSFIFLLLYSQRILEDFLGFSSLLSSAIIALVIAIAFQPLRLYIQGIFDRYLYRESYSYHSTLLEISRSLASILNLDQISHYIYNIIYNTMHPDRVYLYLLGTQVDWMQLVLAHSAMETNASPPGRLSVGSRLITYIASKKDIVLREELMRLSSERGIESVIAEMHRLEIDVVVPIMLEGRLTAVLMLGPKLSGDIYSIEDMGLLVTMANQAAVAINNAQLYEEVRRVRDYNESILANMESGVITVDKQGMVMLFNHAAARIFLLDKNTSVGQHISGISPILTDKVMDALESGNTCSNLEVALPQEGESLPLMISTTILKGIRDDIEGVILVFSDLSRIKELEEERNQAERLAYVGGLAAGLAHEIKNPLVSIKTFAQLLPDKFDDQEFREVFSQLVVKEIERIDLLISQLLGFARSTQAEMMPMNIKDPLDEMLLLLSNRLQERLIETKKHYPPGSVLVFADGGKMKQLFINMFINAIEAMPDGGSLNIDIAPYDRDGDKWFRIMIANTGGKIPPEMKQKVFMPFYSTKPGGTGLGLSICQKIIHEHGGTISLTDEDITRFYIDLPAFKIPSIGIEA